MQEFDFIARATGALPTQAEGLLFGLGDDCAVFTGGASRDWLISTDNYSEGVHFRRDWMGARDIGARALTGAVSDIAAMGGRPRFVTVGISVPPTLSSEDALQFMNGISSAAASYQMILIGGDTTASLKDLQLSLTVIGDVRHGAALYRRGARAGDVVYVTGKLGGALAGLMALQQGRSAPDAVKRHMVPEARVAIGQWLNDTGCVTSMIDVSDGLVQDLGHVAKASGVGMVVDSELVPRWSGDSGVVTLDAACVSGEEYELAFTVDGRRDAAFQRLLPAMLSRIGHPVTRIGTVSAGSGVSVRNKEGSDVTPKVGGFRHTIGREP